jgi:hypothetical protein
MRSLQVPESRIGTRNGVRKKLAYYSNSYLSKERTNKKFRCSLTKINLRSSLNYKK